MAKNNHQSGNKPNLVGILKPYWALLLLLICLAFFASGLSLFLPKILATGIDAYGNNSFVLNKFLLEYGFITLAVFVFTYAQSVVQTYTAEKVARDLRTKLSAKISRQQFVDIQTIGAGKLLTNLTSDVDAVKMFVAQAVVNIVSSLFLIIGACVMLLMIDWQLAVPVLLVIPTISVVFAVIFSRVRILFKKTREVVDWLNRIINESILGASLIRVLYSQKPEEEKFIAANLQAKSLGMSILKLFSSMIPAINFLSNMAMLVILVLGGRFVINGHLTLGNFSAFINYLAIFIFPILLIGFMSNIIAQASSSYQRIYEVLNLPERVEKGTQKGALRGDVLLENVSMKIGEKFLLKDISFFAPAGSKTAIIGPTAAGKTQLLYLLTGLTVPTDGVIKYDGIKISEYDSGSLHQQVGFVFQDSVIFNISLRENIAFNTSVTEENLDKAIVTAELAEYVKSLPEKLNTIVSERGGNLSGGQKQRVMLARALALNPRVLLLDDFTARVDGSTETKILNNIQNNYPGVTLISVTQKISSVEHYDQIILLMEGELLAKGHHDDLMRTSPEYVQIFNSQRSTNHYELQS